jgi:hypothetical protein
MIKNRRTPYSGIRRWNELQRVRLHVRVLLDAYVQFFGAPEDVFPGALDHRLQGAAGGEQLAECAIAIGQWGLAVDAVCGFGCRGCE